MKTLWNKIAQAKASTVAAALFAYLALLLILYAANVIPPSLSIDSFTTLDAIIITPLILLLVWLFSSYD